MKSIILFTKTKITAEKVSNLLIENFPYDKKIAKNDDVELFLGKIPKNFFIFYEDSKNVSEEDLIIDEELIKQIPYENVVCNGLMFDHFDVAKYAVKIISSVYPELYIIDEYNFVGSAKEFIDKDYNCF